MLAGLGEGGGGGDGWLLDHDTRCVYSSRIALHFFRSPRQFSGTSLWVDMAY